MAIALMEKHICKLVSNEEIVLLFTPDFSGILTLLKQGRAAVLDSRKAHRRIQATIRTETTAALLAKGYIFCDLLAVVAGAGHSLLYRILKEETGGALCAKVP